MCAWVCAEGDVSVSVGPCTAGWWGVVAVGVTVAVVCRTGVALLRCRG